MFSNVAVSYRNHKRLPISHNSDILVIYGLELLMISLDNRKYSPFLYSLSQLTYATDGGIVVTCPIILNVPYLRSGSYKSHSVLDWASFRPRLTRRPYSSPKLRLCMNLARGHSLRYFFAKPKAQAKVNSYATSFPLIIVKFMDMQCSKQSKSYSNRFQIWTYSTDN